MEQGEESLSPGARDRNGDGGRLFALSAEQPLAQRVRVLLRGARKK